MREMAMAAVAALVLGAAACSGGKTTATESAATEPAATEPAATEPAKTEPAKTEPAATEPAKTALPVDGKPFPIDPSEFTTEIDNPYWPMRPGSQWVFRETNADGSVSHVVVTVLDKTKMIANGVEARIVHDQVSEGGQVKEDTYDWYAQDADGNLWYLGEDTTEYANGEPTTTEGSWEAGVDGALPGIIMPADPHVGMTYREEYLKGHAEDGASIISTDALAKVPYGRFKGGVQTRNTSGIEPGVIEEKVYAKGVGVVLEITASGGSDRDELLSYREG